MRSNDIQTANTIKYGNGNATSTLDAGNFYVGSSGNVGIATTSPAQELTVGGTIQSADLYGGASDISVDANGNIVRGSASDEKFKTNINQISSPLATVRNLRGVTFDWKHGTRFGTGADIGFVAQEVEDTLPELVGSGGGYKTMDYDNLTALNVEAIKALDNKVAKIDANENADYWQVSQDTDSASSSASSTDTNTDNRSVTDNFRKAVADAVGGVVESGTVVFNKLTANTMVVRNDLKAGNVKAEGEVSGKAGRFENKVCVDDKCMDKDTFKKVVDEFGDSTVPTRGDGGDSDSSKESGSDNGGIEDDDADDSDESKEAGSDGGDAAGDRDNDEDNSGENENGADGDGNDNTSDGQADDESEDGQNQDNSESKQEKEADQKSKKDDTGEKGNEESNADRDKQEGNEDKEKESDADSGDAGDQDSSDGREDSNDGTQESENQQEADGDEGAKDGGSKGKDENDSDE